MVWVEVTWIDIVGGSEWQERVDAAKEQPLVCRSVGQILRKNKKVVVIAASMSEDGEQVGDVTTIPRACVRKIRRLR